MKRGIGSHQSAKSDSDTWLTPQAIIRALGTFDLDPCAAPSPRPWPTATRHIEFPEDGLAANWGTSRIFCNPPYGSKTSEWMQKMASHRSGIALIFARTETECWQDFVWPFANGVLFISGRLCFCFPDGTASKTNSGAPSALIAYSSDDARILRDSGIAGWFVSGQRRVP